MHLYFLRHGRAVEAGEWGGPEPERPLTPEGRDELRRVARGLRWVAPAPVALYTSPYVRARETAELVALALGAPVIAADELKPGADLDELAAVLARASTPQPPDGLFVVGHEPNLSTLVGLLIGWHGPARIEMKKAACARVDIALTNGAPGSLAGRGTLAWLLTAKQLARLGG